MFRRSLPSFLAIFLLSILALVAIWGGDAGARGPKPILPAKNAQYALDPGPFGSQALNITLTVSRDRRHVKLMLGEMDVTCGQDEGFRIDNWQVGHGTISRRGALNVTAHNSGDSSGDPQGTTGVVSYVGDIVLKGQFFSNRQVTGTWRLSKPGRVGGAPCPRSGSWHADLVPPPAPPAGPPGVAYTGHTSHGQKVTLYRTKKNHIVDPSFGDITISCTDPQDGTMSTFSTSGDDVGGFNAPIDADGSFSGQGYGTGVNGGQIDVSGQVNGKTITGHYTYLDQGGCTGGDSFTVSRK